MKKIWISILSFVMMLSAMFTPIHVYAATGVLSSSQSTTVVNLTTAQKTQLVKEIEKEVNNYKAGKTIKVATTYANDKAGKSMKSFKISKKQTTLTVSSDLRSKASTRASDLVKKFSHTRPNGKQWQTIYTNRKTKVMGEDLFTVKAKPTKIDTKYLNWLARYTVYSWHNSASHQAVLTNTKYKYLGVGVYSRKYNGCTEVYVALHVSQYK